MNSLEMDSFDDVIILADESNESSDPDSRTVLTLLMLREMKEKKPEERGCRKQEGVLHAKEKIGQRTNFAIRQR